MSDALIKLIFDVSLGYVLAYIKLKGAYIYIHMGEEKFRKIPLPLYTSELPGGKVLLLPLENWTDLRTNTFTD